MTKTAEPDLKLLIQRTWTQFGRLYNFLSENTIVVPSLSAQEKTEALGRILRTNQFTALQDAIADLCQNPKKKQELHKHLVAFRDAQNQVHFPDEYIEFVSQIHLAAYKKFRASDLATNMISEWKQIAHEFIDPQDHGLVVPCNPLSKTKWFYAGRGGEPTLTDEGQHRLNKIGLTAENGIMLAQSAADALREEWNNALGICVVPKTHVLLRSAQNPTDPFCVITQKDGSSCYTISENNLAFADLRRLFNVGFHEPEHGFQEFMRTADPNLFKNLLASIEHTQLGSILSIGLPGPAMLFDIQEGHKKEKSDLFLVANDAYRHTPRESTAFLHGVLAELQLHQETKIPMTPFARAYVSKNNRYTRAIPKFLRSSTAKTFG